MNSSTGAPPSEGGGGAPPSEGGGGGGAPPSAGGGVGAPFGPSTEVSHFTEFCFEPPLSVAGVWLTVDTHGVKPGEYSGKVSFSGSASEHALNLKLRVSAVAPTPQQAVWVDGYTPPPEGEAFPWQT